MTIFFSRISKVFLYSFFQKNSSFLSVNKRKQRVGLGKDACKHSLSHEAHLNSYKR